MAGVGNILGAIAWLWLIAGFAGNVSGSWDIPIFPAVILVFVASVIRRQAKKDAEAESEEVVARAPVPRSTPPPPTRSPSPQPVARTYRPEPSPVDESVDAILFPAAGDDAAKEVTPQLGDELVDDDHPPKTSEEMIAQARKRWDRKR